MKKVFAFTLLCGVCVGCQSGGQGWPGSALSSKPPVSGGAADTTLASSGGGTAPATASSGTSNAVAAANAGNANAAGADGVEATPISTMGKIWRAIAFQQPAEETPAPVSPEVARFNNFVGAITTQTSQLNINDPPQITRQKAQAILTTLNDWDSILAAGRSVGVINDATAELVTSGVQRLKAETQKLVQYAPHPQTIDAVKQLGTNLGAAYSSIQGILAQGSTVSQALLGGSPQ